jgi:hypothetical protein
VTLLSYITRLNADSVVLSFWSDLYKVVTQDLTITVRNMYVYMYVYMYVRMYVCMYVRMYVCAYVCMYIRMYVCMYVCKYVYRKEFLVVIRSLLHSLNNANT